MPRLKESVVSYIFLIVAVEENARKFWKKIHDKLWLGLGAEVNVVKKKKERKKIAVTKNRTSYFRPLQSY